MGLLAIPVMLLIHFVVSRHQASAVDIFDGSGGFFINYILAQIYFITVLFNNKKFFKFRRIDRRFIILSLIHFSISSFTLNFAVPIFSEFTLWVKIYLFLFYAAFLATCFIDKLPKLIRYLVSFFLGAGFIIVLYFAIYLTPTYLISLLGLLFFGLSLHLLVPLLVSIAIVVAFAKMKKSKIEKRLFLSGILAPLCIVTVFLFQWNGLKKVIHESTASIVTRPNNTLPDWVLFCQDMPSDPFAQKIIKGGLMYDTFIDMWGNRAFSNRAFDEVRKHDPLVNIGLAILGDINLDRNTRVKILKSQFNARHLSQRKLWSGRDLGTIEVLNHIKLMPDYRLAYSEKIITVRNFNQWETNQQEAAFTFYLPEGSVASSLSLWINGKEEKSRLTTKSKADSAYVSIVGVERRDPALMHWQEGNTITVTVFPCTPAENRKFKIGVTTPLRLHNGTLSMQSVYFDGPVSHQIMETSRVEIESQSVLSGVQLPIGFEKEMDGAYTYTGSFQPYWEVSCDVTALSDEAFFFNGNSYSLQDWQPHQHAFVPNKIYIDVNKSWSKEEFFQVLQICQVNEIYVHYDRFIKIGKDNAEEAFNILSQKNFSLFPFGEIDDWEHALLISKSTELSPNLSDLEGSEFLERTINKSLITDEQVNVFQLGGTSSPYLKSLKEFQIINLHSGELDELADLMDQQRFYAYNADHSMVDLPIANMRILKDTAHFASTAPDHLLRLFAYNTIMKQMGEDYFNDHSVFLDNLVEIANEAYILSPVSSLIVLETQRDYDRFDIPENENSLKNASMKSSGAVPEPHEWALIMLMLGILIFVWMRKRKLKLG